MKILFTTPEIGHPAAGGPKLRIENSIKALNRVSELYIVSRVNKMAMGGEPAEDYYRKFCSRLDYVPAARTSFKNKYLSKLQRAVNKVLYKESDFIINYVDQNSIDLIWFGYGNISYPLIREIKQKRPDIKVVCDTDSVWSRYLLRELPYEKSPERRKQIEQEGLQKQKEEDDWVNLCEVTTAVSEVDADYYMSLAKDPSRIHIFSNVIDPESYSVPPLPPADFKKPCMYLAGSFWPNSPMEKAARWVLDNVLPLVRQTLPGIHFYIIGSGSDTTLSDIKDENITITGRLESVLPYLCNSDVALVPLWFESGTRFKILEAGACKRPIISTTLGAEGIPVADGKDIIIADTPEAFAAGIVQIVKDPGLAKKLAENSYNLVEENYSVQTAAWEAEQILKYICG